MEQMGSLLTAAGVLLGILSGFSIPVIFGTVFGTVLKPRKLHFLIKAIRYLIAWWAAIVVVVFGIMTVVSLFSTSTSKMPVGVGLIAMAIATLLIFLALRRYQKEKSTMAPTISAG